MKWKDVVNPMQMDVLKEIGNIGAGNAATSLSTMISKEVEIDVPTVKLVDLSEIYEYLKNPEEIVASTIVGIKGEAPGKMLMNFDSDSTKHLIELLTGQRPEDLTNMNEMERSVISEIGNIICSTYVISLSNFTSLFLETEVPILLVDMFAAIISETSIMASKEYDDVLMIETILKVHNGQKLNGFLTMFPEPGSLDVIFKKLGLS
ncbi:CheY-P phosphatase CheC [Athalassotoga saccharophila]|uniref:CheY-P phosphatase CheC n=1 Tax=Athalassotoga saccharophila TaxID=1441386 RepID=UPI00137AA946|nr:CheY-P phosphatase CheC [Athalassotoga saccharophila]BBJ27276.1 chemotaxis protein CheC [Athalassotoga saccharophila]